jgi:hypothetical protein
MMRRTEKLGGNTFNLKCKFRVGLHNDIRDLAFLIEKRLSGNQMPSPELAQLRAMLGLQLTEAAALGNAV